MSAFDKVVGYETIKNELLQICDMIHNKEIYEKMGAKLPHGILLTGDPGVGKTLLSKCFIDESGLKSYIIRRNKSSDDFVKYITATFKEAKKNSPSVIFLDDIDKFANEDIHHRNAEEYIAVQSGIDEVKSSDVFVIATANEPWVLPDSLKRSGRFDKKIKIMYPTDKDANIIIEHYLSDKRISESVNMEDLSNMISFSSCAQLESIINEAAINAAFERKDSIEMDDLVKAVLRTQYYSPDNYAKTSAEDINRIALHEAGHLVVCEVLEPGSVGIASIRSKGRNSKGGFIHCCKELSSRSYNILVSLAGKAAVDLYYSDSFPDGCQSDIEHAFSIIRDGVSKSATHGLGMIDVSIARFNEISESMNSRNETVTQAELERYMIQVKNIILKNKNFLEKTAQLLVEKETLLYSDIRKLRNSVIITKTTV